MWLDCLKAFHMSIKTIVSHLMRIVGNILANIFQLTHTQQTWGNISISLEHVCESDSTSKGCDMYQRCFGLQRQISSIVWKIQGRAKVSSHHSFLSILLEKCEVHTA